MEKPSSTSLFQVYLRLRPPPSPLVQLTPQSLYPTLPPPERYLTVEPAGSQDGVPTHITIHPPSDSRKRAVEKFAFTRVFEEQAEQIDIFKGTGVVPLVEGVLNGGRDGLVATLGVTGSGKSHTILGSKSQRGLMQMSLDLLYSSIGSRMLHPSERPSLIGSLAATDASEAQILPAQTYLEIIYGDGGASRAQTPITEYHQTPIAARRKMPQRPSALPQFPSVSELVAPIESNMEYTIIISMFEVYNDRIFDLLAVPSNQKDLRRRALLFKPTELSPDRKVVAGLRKIVCGSYEEALVVLETGLTERRIAGTGSNSVSSRSHGFFCLEVKKRPRGGMANSWTGANLTIVDLAGSERARNAKTAGATLAEAGKINESLMYLGQCLQMQSDSHDGNKPTLVPFRQCKLTELLFSNSFPSSTPGTNHSSRVCTRNPQNAVMIVTADPLGDFNATSQILRYSALAREVTVPRIPSVSSTILAGIPGSRSASGRTSPPGANGGVDEGVVEMAFSELARLNEEVQLLGLRLDEEEKRRREAEEGWARAEMRAEEVELEVREEMWKEMETLIEEERNRWKDLHAEEGARGEEHFDKKLDILTKGIQVHEDGDASGEYAERLERDNDELRAKVEKLERELQGRSPTKKKSAVARKPTPMLDASKDVLGDAMSKMNGLSLMSPEPVQEKPVEQKTPAAVRKMRKLTTRQWDLMDEEELQLYERF